MERSGEHNGPKRALLIKWMNEDYSVVRIECKFIPGFESFTVREFTYSIGGPVFLALG